MTEEQLLAVRELHAAADALRLACVEAIGGKALLHIAFDREADPLLQPVEVVLLTQLKAIR